MADQPLLKSANPGFEYNSDLIYEIGFRNALRYDYIRKFGTVPDVQAAAPEDVWDEGGIYTFPSDSGVAMTISSSDVDDVDGGAGAENATIIGLGANGEVKRETVALNGQTGVSVGIYSRVFRVIILGAQVSQGDVYVGSGTITTGVPANIFAKILVGKAQTQMAIFTVPSNMEGSLLQWKTSVIGTGTKNAFISLLIRVNGNQFVGIDDVSLTQPAQYQTRFPIGEYLMPMQDVKIQADVDNNNLTIQGKFCILLKTLVNPTSDPIKGF